MAACAPLRGTRQAWGQEEGVVRGTLRFCILTQGVDNLDQALIHPATVPQKGKDLRTTFVELLYTLDAP